MKRLIVIVIFASTQLMGQTTLTNFFDEAYMNQTSREDRITISRVMNNYFVRENISIPQRADCIDISSSYDQNELVSTVISQLEGKIDNYDLEIFEARISSELFECLLVQHFYLEKNGLSIAENEYRAFLISQYEIDSMSNEGKEVFFSHYPDIYSKIYIREGLISGQILRIDSIRILSRHYFLNKLSKKDGTVLDRFWEQREKLKLEYLVKRDTLHKEGLVILKNHVDSLIQLYNTKIMEERKLILSQLDSTDRICLTTLKSQLINKLIKRGKNSYEGAKRMYLDLAPNMWYGLDYNHNLMKKFPSIQFARRVMKFRNDCNNSVRKMKDLPYVYLEFEEKLNEIVKKHSVSRGTIYYNRNEYNEKYKKTGLLNMLLYYID